MTNGTSYTYSKFSDDNPVNAPFEMVAILFSLMNLENKQYRINKWYLFNFRIEFVDIL